MILHVVFAQREERYAGEHAPEALFIVTEYDYDENPDWINERLQEIKSDGEYIAAEIFKIDLGPGGQERIRASLLDRPTLKGTVL